MDKWVFLSGRFVTSDDAHVHIYDHGFLYGDGAFEGIRAYNGNVFKLDRHVDRLYRSLHALAIEMPYGPGVFADNVRKLVAKSEVGDAYIRVTVSRGVSLGLDPKNVKTEPTVVISTDKLALYPQSMYENGLEVVTVATRISNPQVMEVRIKSLGKYVTNIQAKLEANHVGAGEGLMLSEDGWVAECTGDNVFFVKDGVVYTPPPWIGILQGITRDTVIEIVRAMGISVVEDMFTRFDLYNADESFLTGTAAEVIPMVKLDGRKIADGKPGNMTRRIMTAFKDYVKSQG
jgi:branched-chain amino acid aminotransferase